MVRKTISSFAHSHTAHQINPARNYPITIPTIAGSLINSKLTTIVAAAPANAAAYAKAQGPASFSPHRALPGYAKVAVGVIVVVAQSIA